MSVEVKLDRASKFYEPGERVTGTIIINDTQTIVTHTGITLEAFAYMDTVSMIRGNIGRGALKEEDKIYMMKKKESLQDSGKANSQQPIPFSFVLEANQPGQQLLDAYIGVEFSVIYEIIVVVNKSQKPLKGTEKFYCNVPGAGIDVKYGKSFIPKDFKITPDGLEANTTSNKAVPKFHFEGQIYTANCDFNQPFDGFIIIKESDYQIKSIEVQLVRVETFEGKTQATEVQNIQVADGSVITNLEIPLYMLFPKIYSCATVQHEKFTIEFQINLIVIFINGYQLTESFPIRIYR